MILQQWLLHSLRNIFFQLDVLGLSAVSDDNPRQAVTAKRSFNFELTGYIMHWEWMSSEVEPMAYWGGLYGAHDSQNAIQTDDNNKLSECCNSLSREEH